MGSLYVRKANTNQGNLDKGRYTSYEQTPVEILLTACKKLEEVLPALHPDSQTFHSRLRPDLPKPSRLKQFL